MLGRPTIARPARAAALAAAAALALTACGGSGDDGAASDGSSAVAAVVDGQEITVGDVQRTTRELHTFIEHQQPGASQQLTTDSVAALLTQVPAVLEFGKQQGLPVPSAGTIRQEIDTVVPAASDGTVDVLRANALSAQLDQDQRNQLVKAIQAQHPKISPRYASSAGSQPDWLEAPAEQQMPTGTP